MEQKSIDHEWTDRPICPSCGYEFYDAWDMGFEGDESTIEVECDCGAVFDATMSITTRFSTELKKSDARKR